MVDERSTMASADESMTTESPDEVLSDIAVLVRDGVIGAAAGFAGTTAMTVVLFIAVSFDAFDFSSIAALSEIVGLGDSLLIGYLIFLAGGMVTWPLLFASLGRYVPGGSTPQRGLSFATVMWTGFVLAFYTEQTGLALALYAVLTLVAHWIYGFVLGAAFDFFAERIPAFDLSNAPFA